MNHATEKAKNPRVENAKKGRTNAMAMRLPTFTTAGGTGNGVLNTRRNDETKPIQQILHHQCLTDGAGSRGNWEGDGIAGGVNAVDEGVNFVHEGVNTVHEGLNTVHEGVKEFHEGVIVVHEDVIVVHEHVIVVHEGVKGGFADVQAVLSGAKTRFVGKSGEKSAVLLNPDAQHDEISSRDCGVKGENIVG